MLTNVRNCTQCVQYIPIYNNIPIQCKSIKVVKKKKENGSSSSSG